MQAKARQRRNKKTLQLNIDFSISEATKEKMKQSAKDFMVTTLLNLGACIVLAGLILFVMGLGS